jgi:hypothetical protein
MYAKSLQEMAGLIQGDLVRNRKMSSQTTGGCFTHNTAPNWTKSSKRQPTVDNLALVSLAGFLTWTITEDPDSQIQRTVGVAKVVWPSCLLTKSLPSLLSHGVHVV